MFGFSEHLCIRHRPIAPLLYFIDKFLLGQVRSVLVQFGWRELREHVVRIAFALNPPFGVMEPNKDPCNVVGVIVDE
ncbi:hypothetical protein WJ09_19320 [Burkholderia vietnamiensis]|nr:hypothetical protein WJ09_19320 [Burkholderia vietnamiensis]